MVGDEILGHQRLSASISNSDVSTVLGVVDLDENGDHRNRPVKRGSEKLKRHA